MSDAKRPKVSIGLPVYNGEIYVAAAIRSILAQTFEDFELLICDNASTDATGEICREFAARDRRVRYHRNAANLGAGPNFNLAFNLASGEYFKWAAHDDMIEPEFLEKCVATLDANPDAVLCYTLVRRLDGDRDVGVYDSALRGADAGSPLERFAALILLPHMCTEVFGLVRTRALDGTPLMASYRSSDLTLLAILALRGRLISIPEPLFVHRDHAGRFGQGPLYNRAACMAWYEPNNAGKRAWNSWTLLAELARGIRREVADGRERRRCYARLLRWPCVGVDAQYLVADFFWGVDPRIFRAVRGVKRLVARVSGHSRQQGTEAACGRTAGETMTPARSELEAGGEGRRRPVRTPSV